MILIGFKSLLLQCIGVDNCEIQPVSVLGGQSPIPQLRDQQRHAAGVLAAPPQYFSAICNS